MRSPRHDLRDYTPGRPQVERVVVSFVSEEKLWRSVGCGANVGDFLVGRLGRGVAGHPGDAEIGEVGGSGGGGEEDVGGFDVPVDDVEGVDVGETEEEVVEVGFRLLWGKRGTRRVVEKDIKVDGKEGEDEGEYAAGEGKGPEEGEDVGVFGFGEDAGFAEGFVRSGTL